MWISEQLVRQPCRFCCLVLAIPLIVSILLGVTGLFELNEDNVNDWVLRDHFQTKRNDALVKADEDIIDMGSEPFERSVLVDYLSMVVLYESNDASASVFTEENIVRIAAIEKIITTFADIDQACLTDGVDKSKCSESNELPWKFTALSYFWNDSSKTVNDIPTTLNTMKSDLTTKGASYFFGDDYAIGTNEDSTRTRSLFRFGLPIAGYNNPMKDMMDQITETVDIQYDLYEALQDEPEYDCDSCKFKLLVSGMSLMDREMLNLAINDSFFITLAILFVWIYMTIHMKSLLLASGGMLQILLSFPMAYFFYRVLFGIDYFVSFHTMSAFVILGIGADDCFVFVDAWNQSAHEIVETSLIKRMDYTLHRSAKAMFVTSFTTFSAFVATSVSDLKPISTFGSYAAWLVVVNYFLVVTYFPAVVILWHTRFRFVKWKTLLTTCKRRNRLIDEDGKPFDKNEIEVHTDKFTETTSTTSDIELVKVDVKKTDTDEAEQPKKVEIVGNNGDYDETKKNNNDNDDDGEKPENHEQQQEEDVSEEQKQEQEDKDKDKKQEETVSKKEITSKKETSPENEMVEIELPGNNNEVHPIAMKQQKLRLIEKFFSGWWCENVYKYRIAIIIVFMVSLCAGIALLAQLHTITKQEIWLPEDSDLVIANDVSNDEYLKSQESLSVYVLLAYGVSGIDRSGTNKYDPEDIGEVVWDNTFDLSDPLAQQHLYDTCISLKNDPTLVLNKDTDCFIESFRDFIVNNKSGQFPVEYPAAATVAERKLAFVNDLKEFNTFNPYFLNRRFINIVDDKLWYVIIGGNSGLDLYLSYDDSKPIFDRYESFVEKQNAAGPDTLNKAFQNSEFNWLWMFTQKRFVDNLIFGIVVSLSVATIVMIFFTQNIIVAVLTMLNIAGIVSWVLASMYLLGWELGVTESIAGVILVGFSFDYAVHYANSYNESLETTRKERMRRSYREMGISIFAGAITTSGAGATMLFCVLAFFTKFATIMVLNIIYSLLWSSTFLGAVLMTLGPVGKQGSFPIVKWCTNLFKKIKGNKKN